MQKARFDEYIRRFNAEDATAFDEFLQPDMRMQNGTLVYYGVQGMKDHYAKIWGRFKETLVVPRFVSDDDVLAIEMETNFLALHDDEDTIFGPVREGDQFDFRGLIMYSLRDDKFADIRVAYNSFTFTGADGTVRELGIPH